MSSKFVYTEIIEAIQTKSRIIVEKKECDNECEYLCLLALETVLLGNDIYDSKEILESVSLDECNDYGKSIFQEVVLSIKSREKKELDKLIQVADKILELNSDAAMARSVKGYIAIRLGNAEGGIENYLEIINLYPNAAWVYPQMVRTLYGFQKRKEARNFIPLIQPRSLKYLYIAGNFFSSKLNYLYLILFFVLALLPNSLCALLFFIVFPATLAIYSLIRKETTLIFQFTKTSVEVLLLLFLASIILNR